MTKMAGMPIYGKNPLKNLLLSCVRLPWNLEESKMDLSPTKVIKDCPSLTLTYFNLCLMETKVYIIGPDHMTKISAMPIYGKIIKNLLLRNHKSDYLET